jgi:hypothetical protein
MFVNDTIDTGSLTVKVWHTINLLGNGQPEHGGYPQSPYGVWGALGTINCGETAAP